jgi:hypothetical protein
MLPTNLLPNEAALVDFCDRDTNWGPLLFLRPARADRMSPGRTAAGAVLLGIPLGLFAAIVLTLMARALSRPVPPVGYFPPLLTVAYWVVAQFTLARAWNRRAARLARWASD